MVRIFGIIIMVGSAIASAEVITLKDGTTIKAKIVQASTETITVEYYGSKVTYKLREIESIDGKKIAYTPPKKLSGLTTETQQRKYVATLMEGQEHLKNGQYNQAIEVFKKALGINPKHISAYNGIAAAHLSLKQFEEAISYCDKGIAVDSEFPNIYGIRGQAKFFLRKYDEAEKDLKKAIDLLETPTKYPANDNLLAYIENLLTAVRQQREYERLPQPSVAMSQPESAEIQYLRHIDQIRDYIFREQYLQAIEECEKALAMNKKGDQAYLYLGQAYEGVGRYPQAQEAYQKAISFNPNNAEAYYNLAILYSTRLRDNQKALEYLKKTIEIDPEYAPAHHNLALLFASSSNKQKATEHYRKAIELFEKKGEQYYAQNVRRDFKRFSSQLRGLSVTPKSKRWSYWLKASAKIVVIGLLVVSVIAVIIIYRKSPR